MIPEVFLQITVPARPLRAACQSEAAKRGRNVSSLLILDDFAGKSFVLTILQRNPVCNLKKTTTLRPKYGWGYPMFLPGAPGPSLLGTGGNHAPHPSSPHPIN